ncbi:MAG TPA: hypothetical protein VF764_12535 [Steroidobacteraceae bacterium]
MTTDPPPEPWWFAHLDSHNQILIRELFYKLQGEITAEKETATRFARELADLRIKYALLCNEAERLTALLEPPP